MSQWRWFIFPFPSSPRRASRWLNLSYDQPSAPDAPSGVAPVFLKYGLFHGNVRWTHWAYDQLPGHSVWPQSWESVGTGNPLPAQYGHYEQGGYQSFNMVYIAWLLNQTNSTNASDYVTKMFADMAGDPSAPYQCIDDGTTIYIPGSQVIYPTMLIQVLQSGKP